MTKNTVNAEIVLNNLSPEARMAVVEYVRAQILADIAKTFSASVTPKKTFSANEEGKRGRKGVTDPDGKSPTQIIKEAPLDMPVDEVLSMVKERVGVDISKYSVYTARAAVRKLEKEKERAEKAVARAEARKAKKASKKVDKPSKELEVTV